jgi:hypothetical protein
VKLRNPIRCAISVARSIGSCLSIKNNIRIIQIREVNWED